MNFIGLLPAVLIPVFLGALFVKWLLNDEAAFIESLLFGIGAGFGLLTFEMFILGLLRTPYTVFNITAPLVFFIFLFIYLLYKSGCKRAVFAASDLKGIKLCLSIVICLWLAVKLGFVFYETFNRPIHSWDTWANWSVGAKLFYYNKGLMLDAASENFFGKGYRPFIGHPIHVSLLETWFALWLGNFHEIYVKAWSFFYFLGSLGVFFYALRRESGSVFYGFFGAFLLSTAPLLVFHGQDAYADLPLSYYAFTATICFWRFHATDNKKFILLSGLFVASGTFVKNEGVFFFMAIGTALLLSMFLARKFKAETLVYFLLPVIAVAGPWYVFKLANGLGFGHSGAQSGFSWLSDPRFKQDAPKGIHWEIVPVAIREIFFKANFSLLFPFWVVVTVLGFKEIMRSKLKYLYFIAGSVIAMFVFVYLTLEVTAVTDITGIQRNFLTFAPIVFFITACLAFRLWPRSK